MYSRLILGNAYNLWILYSVLSQVALWGKGDIESCSGYFYLNLSANSVREDMYTQEGR